MDVRRLPGETSLRFLLLIAAVLGSTLAVAESLWYTVFQREASEVLGRCLTDALCRRPQEHERVLWVLGAGVLIGLLGVAAAALGSVLRRRARRLVPVPALPVLTSVITKVLATNGMPHVPVLRSAQRPTAQARADGITSTYVEVGTNWMALAATQPARAEAVLHHEVAHLRAKDILPSRVSLWLTNVFVVYAVVFIAMTAGSGLRITAEAALRVAIAVVVVVLARMAVLRAREHAADIEAAAFDPVAQAANFSGHGKAPTGLRQAFATHPDPDRRRRIVDRPVLATRLNAVDGVLVGVTASITAPVLTRLWRSWFQFGDPAYWSELVGWGVVGALLGAWLAIMVFRAVAGARAGGEPVRLGAFSWLLSLTMVVGRLVYGTSLGVPVTNPLAKPVGVVTLLVLAFGVVAVVHWLHGFVDWWLDLGPSRRRSTALAVPVIFAAMVGAGVLGVLGHLAHMGSIAGDGYFIVVQLLLTEGAAVVVLPAVAILGAGLLVALRRRVGGPLPPWLDSRGAPSPEKIPVLVTIAIGMCAGALAAGMLATFTAGWDPQEAARASWFVAAGLEYGSQAVVGGVVAAGAVVAALVARRGSLQHTAIAGAVGTTCATAGAWLVQAVDRGRIDFTTLPSTFADVLVVGLMGGMVGSAVVLTAWPARLPAPGARWATGAALVLITAVATVGMSVAAMSAKPSVQRDLVHFHQTFVSMQGELTTALQSCEAGPVETKSLRTELWERSAPATTEVRELAGILASVLAMCEQQTDRTEVAAEFARFEKLFTTMWS